MKNNSIDEQYPHVAEWVNSYGWIELGQQYDAPFVMALNEGGTVWEGKTDYATLDDAFRALDKALAKWIKENG